MKLSPEEREARAREADYLLNNKVLNQALDAIEHGAQEDLLRGGDDATSRARINTVRDFRRLLQMAILDNQQSVRPKSVA